MHLALRVNRHSAQLRAKTARTASFPQPQQLELSAKGEAAEVSLFCGTFKSFNHFVQVKHILNVVKVRKHRCGGTNHKKARGRTEQYVGCWWKNIDQIASTPSGAVSSQQRRR